jgi:hypothetical protein
MSGARFRPDSTYLAQCTPQPRQHVKYALSKHGLPFCVPFRRGEIEWNRLPHNRVDINLRHVAVAAASGERPDSLIDPS